MKKKTNSELLKEIADIRQANDLDWKGAVEKIDNLQKDLNTEKAKCSMVTRDLDRIKSAMDDKEKSEGFIKAAISSRLASNFGMNVQPQTEWFRGEQIEEKGITEEVRFLRHLYRMIDSSAPF
jgi:hypothetical protein